MQPWEPIDAKLREAHTDLRRMREAPDARRFVYATNAFLAAARTVPELLRSQFGWDTHNPPRGLSQVKEAKRKAFDAWLSQAAAIVLSHPLKHARDAVIHRTGVPPVRYRLQPTGGLSLEPDWGPLDQPRAVSRRGIGLPLEGPAAEDWFFEGLPQQTAVDACASWLADIERLVEAALREA